MSDKNLIVTDLGFISSLISDATIQDVDKRFAKS